jgi:hypothetical protein
MTPKEKAKYLKDKFQKQIFFHVTDERLDINEAKGLALIAVDELIKTICYCYPINEYEISFVEYWQEVKQEIEKL